MDTGFSSIFHDKIILKADTPLHLEYGDSSEVIEAGSELVIKKDDERLLKGCLLDTSRCV